MSKIQAGSLVEVVDDGYTYSQYSTLFNHTKEELGFEINHAYNRHPIEGETYCVLVVVNHPDTGKPIALIHNDNRNAYLVGLEGLELVN